MKNKNYFKRNIILIFLVIIVFISVLFIISKYEYQRYNVNFNYKISAILDKVIDNNESISKEELVKILQSEDANKFNLKEYGYDIDKDIYISTNEKLNIYISIIKISLLIICFSIILYLYIEEHKKRDKEIDKITKLIEEINHKNYELNIEELSEDKLSILKEEIYKTTIMLKENAENSIKDKINLKTYIEDISHQLKTPLTSINILIDNIIDNPDMEKDVEEKFLRRIKREASNITFLVQSLLKLSQFETNTIEFIRNGIDINIILDNVIKNVSSLSDLKNITIKVDNKCQNKIYCDSKWQVEALTNILKNALEYSNNNSAVYIKCEENLLYSEIMIKDYGKGMGDMDRKNIFKRFYKGKNASKDSVGIGVSLAKSIIEKDNGKIIINSKDGIGTEFIIRYFYK